MSRSGSTDPSLAERLVGGLAGRPLRAWYYRRKVARAAAGRTTRVRARVHRRSAPVWREERGSLVATARSLRWRPLIRRWRGVDLSTATVVATGRTDAAGAGGGSGSALGLPPEIDRLVVSLDAAPVVAAMLEMRRSTP